MSDEFKTITGDDWKRSIATARSEPNKAVEQIRIEEIRRDLRIEVQFSDGRWTTLTRTEYDALKASGMLWEFHPGAPLDWPEKVCAVDPSPNTYRCPHSIKHRAEPCLHCPHLQPRQS